MARLFFTLFKSIFDEKRYLVTIRLVTYKTGQTAICMCSRLCIRRVLLTYTRVWRYVDAVVRYLFTSV